MHLKINLFNKFYYANMGLEVQTTDVLYHPIIADARVNWASPLDVIAAASDESGNRGIVPFSFISDKRGINTYFRELKLADGLKEPESRLFSERMVFEYDRKDYATSQEVSSALNSEFLRRVQNHDNKPSYYQVSPKLRYRLNDLATPTRKLVVPAGIGFCDRFACDRDGRLLYPKQD